MMLYEWIPNGMQKKLINANTISFCPSGPKFSLTLHTRCLTSSSDPLRWANLALNGSLSLGIRVSESLENILQLLHNCWISFDCLGECFTIIR